jgi:hypothetical protein
LSIGDLGDAFERTSIESSLEVLDNASTTFRSEHTFCIKARIAARFYQRKFAWTGSGASEEPPPDLITDYDNWGFPRHRIHGPVIRENTSRIVLVDLGRTMSKGETDTVHFVHRLKDLNATFVPYLGISPRSGTNKISLKVVLPDALSGHVFFEERTTDTNTAIASEKLTASEEMDGRKTFKHEVRRPETSNRTYQIAWRSLGQ